MSLFACMNSLTLRQFSHSKLVDFINSKETVKNTSKLYKRFHQINKKCEKKQGVEYVAHSWI